MWKTLADWMLAFFGMAQQLEELRDTIRRLEERIRTTARPRMNRRLSWIDHCRCRDLLISVTHLHGHALDFTPCAPGFRQQLRPPPLVAVPQHGRSSRRVVRSQSSRRAGRSAFQTTGQILGSCIPVHTRRRMALVARIAETSLSTAMPLRVQFGMPLLDQ
jgi:hypothetical protein